MNNINKVTKYSNKNDYKMYIVENGKFRLGNWEFKNREDIIKCIRIILSTIKHYEQINDIDIITFIHDLIQYHHRYESELKYYIGNYNLMAIVNDDYDVTYSNFAFYKIEDDNTIIYREFSTTKTIKNIPQTNKLENKENIKKFLEKIINNKMTKINLNEILHENIDKFVKNYQNLSLPGVYMIDDYYIGKSNNIKNRIISHLEESLRWKLFETQTSNMEKCKKIIETIKECNKINVTILSKDMNDEKDIINEYSNKQYLTNKIYNNNYKQTAVRKRYIASNDYKYISVEKLN